MTVMMMYRHALPKRLTLRHQQPFPSLQVPIQIWNGASYPQYRLGHKGTIEPVTGGTCYHLAWARLPVVHNQARRIARDESQGVQELFIYEQYSIIRSGSLESRGVLGRVTVYRSYQVTRGSLQNGEDCQVHLHLSTYSFPL
jgi:hypothetical protein